MQSAVQELNLTVLFGCKNIKATWQVCCLMIMAEKVPCWIADRTINDNRRVVTYHDTRVSHFGVVVFRRHQSLLCEKPWRIFQLRKSYSFEASEIGTEIDMSLLLTEYDFFPQAEDNIWNKIIDSSEGDNLKWIKRSILWKTKFVEK